MSDSDSYSDLDYSSDDNELNEYDTERKISDICFNLQQYCEHNCLPIFNCSNIHQYFYKKIMKL